MTVYLNSIRTAKRHLRAARNTRQIAYNVDLGYHGEAALVTEGVYRFFPSPGHRGWLVEAAALTFGRTTLVL